MHELVCSKQIESLVTASNQSMPTCEQCSDSKWSGNTPAAGVPARVMDLISFVGQVCAMYDLRNACHGYVCRSHIATPKEEWVRDMHR